MIQMFQLSQEEIPIYKIKKKLLRSKKRLKDQKSKKGLKRTKNKVKEDQK